MSMGDAWMQESAAKALAELVTVAIDAALAERGRLRSNAEQFEKILGYKDNLIEQACTEGKRLEAENAALRRVADAASAVVVVLTHVGARGLPTINAGDAEIKTLVEALFALPKREREETEGDDDGPTDHEDLGRERFEMWEE